VLKRVIPMYFEGLLCAATTLGQAPANLNGEGLRRKEQFAIQLS
jgi:hypothetical protein